MRIIVVKLGGSVLVDLSSYHRCARFLRDGIRRESGSRHVVVVSARFGETDALLEMAQSICRTPDPRTLDLLWSTGELWSAATLALCLDAEGVRAGALDVQQTGIRRICDLEVDPGPLRHALANHEVVIVPGFLATGRGGSVVSLGRGGSDLTAVAMASALSADRCELVKDVPGYFTADPNRDPAAEHLSGIDYARALRMAEEGCDLVQPAALEAASRAGLTVVIRALDDPRHTIINSRLPTSNCQLPTSKVQLPSPTSTLKLPTSCAELRMCSLRDRERSSRSINAESAEVQRDAERS